MDQKLQDWFNEQRESTPDTMIYKEASGEQIMFVRDRVGPLLGAGLKYEQRDGLVRVVSSHTSKSVRLPVYSVTRADLGLRFVMRDNFYNWKLSVISRKPVECDFSGLFYTTPPTDPSYTGNPLSDVYFEGFPPDLVFGYYSQNPRQWSAELYGHYSLMTTLFMIMRWAGAIKPLRWNSRADRAAD